MKRALIFFILFSIAFSQRLVESRLGKACSPQNETNVCGNELVCLDRTNNVTTTLGLCSYCSVETQCWSKSYVLACKTSINSRNLVVMTCQHKDLFPRLTWFDFGATVANFFGAMISTAGGIGGGGIYVPLLYGIGQFPLDLCVPLSKAMVLGGAVANIMLSSQERHPHADKPLIYYDVATFFEPAVLLGTTIGVICNMMFPNWLIVALLITVLSIMTLRVFVKGIQLCIQEHKQNQLAQTDSDLVKNEKVDYKGDGEQSKPLLDSEVGTEVPQSDHGATIQEIKEQEARTPWFQLILVSFCWIVIFIAALFKGGHGVQSIVGITTCSPAFWVLFALPFPIIITLMILFAAYLFYQTQKKKKVNYQHAKGDIEWNLLNLFLFPFYFALAGFFASLLGIGSGMLKAPVLVELGLEPVVAAATSTYMILFTASITVAQYTFLGRMPFDYGIWFAITGFLAALIGQLVIGFLVRKYKMQSLIVFLVVFVMAISVLLMGGLGIAKVVISVQNGEYLGFKTPC